MAKIGPFFCINGILVYDACDLCDGRRQADMLDNSCGHDGLFEKYFGSEDEYIDYPRGRVVWDCSSGSAVVYIDPCINNEKVLGEIKKAFDIDGFRVAQDEHYHCRNCTGSLFDD